MFIYFLFFALICNIKLKNMLETKEKKKPKSLGDVRTKRNLKPRFFFFLFFAFAAVLSGSYIVWKNGLPELSQERKNKLEKALEKIDNAEQYALIATINGTYPCLNCPNAKTIFLNIGEVWKYGITVNGEKRYTPTFLNDNSLAYKPQFLGDVTACLKEEQNKIFHYPLLPENLNRLPNNQLDRPPGNPQDR